MIKKVDEGKDDRVPIVYALLSIHGSRLSNEELSDYVMVLMEMESQWLEKIRQQRLLFHIIMKNWASKSGPESLCTEDAIAL